MYCTSRTHRAALLLLALSLTWLPAATSHAQFDDVEITTTHVAGNIYMLEGAGGNIGVSVGPDGILMVDDQFAPLADKIRDALAGLGGSGRRTELMFLLNTHWHGDHTSGNPVWGPEAPIIAHRNVRERLEHGMQIPGRERDPMAPEGLPVITFSESLSVHFNGEEIRVIHVPAGHTDGDAIVWFTGSNVVHMGDQMFSGRFPIIDFDSGGTVAGYLRNVEAVLDQIPEDARIIPGHGPLSSVDDLRRFHQMIEETSGIVADRVRAGKSLEEIQKEGLPDRWEDWPWRNVTTERWLATLYQESAPGR